MKGTGGARTGVSSVYQGPRVGSLEAAWYAEEASLITRSGVGGHAGAQSNKLVGITRSRGGRRGGGVAAHHRPSSPPISEALSRAGSFAHECNAYVHISRGYGASRFPRNSLLPLVEAAMIP